MASWFVAGIRRATPFGLWTGALVLALVAVSPSVYAQQVGYVVDFEGRWFVNSQPVVRKGQSLPGGGTVSRQSASEFDYIAIADLHGNIVARKNCNARGECDSPIRLASAPPQRGLAATAFGAVMRLVWGEPDRYSVHRSRSEELSDGIVELKGGKIDLSSVFKNSETGQHYLRLVSLAPKVKGAKPKSIGPVVYDSQQAAPVSVPALQPGLYELILLEQHNGVYSPTEVTAWVLVRSGKDYQKSLASYEEAAALTKTWGSEVTPEAARGFLRAQLDQLSRKSVE